MKQIIISLNALFVIFEIKLYTHMEMLFCICSLGCLQEVLPHHMDISLRITISEMLCLSISTYLMKYQFHGYEDKTVLFFQKETCSRGGS